MLGWAGNKGYPRHTGPAPAALGRGRGAAGGERGQDSRCPERPERLVAILTLQRQALLVGVREQRVWQIVASPLLQLQRQPSRVL